MKKATMHDTENISMEVAIEALGMSIAQLEAVVCCKHQVQKQQRRQLAAF